MSQMLCIVYSCLWVNMHVMCVDCTILVVLCMFVTVGDTQLYSLFYSYVVLCCVYECLYYFLSDSSRFLDRIYYTVVCLYSNSIILVDCVLDVLAPFICIVR